MRNYSLFAVAGIFLGALLINPVAAGNTSEPSSVKRLFTWATHGTNGQGVAFIYVFATRVSPPACASTDRFVVDLGTASGQAAYGQALTAKLSDRSVMIYGTGDCSVYANSESVMGIEIH